MRRVKTSRLELNYYGFYVCYLVDYRRPKGPSRSALWIMAGPSAGKWWFTS